MSTEQQRRERALLLIGSQLAFIAEAAGVSYSPSAMDTSITLCREFFERGGVDVEKDDPWYVAALVSNCALQLAIEAPREGELASIGIKRIIGSLWVFADMLKRIAAGETVVLTPEERQVLRDMEKHL